MTSAVAPRPKQVMAAQSKPLYMITVLVLTDALALLAAVATSEILKLIVRRSADIGPYLRLWPFLFVFLAFYGAVGLYGGAALRPPEELRRATFSSVFLFPSVAILTASWRGPSHFLTWTLGLAVLLATILVPLFRGLVRQLCSNKSWWGYPTVVFGSGDLLRLITEELRRESTFGLRVVAVFDQEGKGAQYEAIENLPDIESAAEFAARFNSPYAVVAMPRAEPEEVMSIIENYISPFFTRILVVPDLCQWSSLWVKPKPFGSMLGLEVLQKGALYNAHLSKRVLDLLLSSIALITLAPVFAVIGLAIKFSSPGPIFYSQKRIGQNGRVFRAWKFRTMVQNADEILAQQLAQDPAARAEWEETHKLKNDARVTRIGRILRKTSADELPQLWNVLISDMSLVGPRPIVKAEVSKYGQYYSLYAQVKGGVTGLWQISGRNDVSYETRVRLDSYYVRNWSMWLDLCICDQTIKTVLFRSGAY